MRPLPFLVLFIPSLLCYGVLVSLSIIPADPGAANRNLYVVFILYGSVFYFIGTLLQAVAIPVFFDVWFNDPANRKKRLRLFVLPVLMLAYFIYVIVTGS